MKTKYNISAFIFIGILGSLSHFFYDWSGSNRIIGYFFATSESTWEHLKLLFFPTVIYSVFEYFFVKREVKNYIPSVIISVIVGMFTIVALFYTYQGVLGYNIDFLNILIYFLGLFAMLVVKNKIINSEYFASTKSSILFLAVGIIIAFLFFRFTYNVPTLGIFTPPINV